MSWTRPTVATKFSACSVEGFACRSQDMLVIRKAELITDVTSEASFSVQVNAEIGNIQISSTADRAHALEEAVLSQASCLSQTVLYDTDTPTPHLPPNVPQHQQRRNIYLRSWLRKLEGRQTASRLTAGAQGSSVRPRPFSPHLDGKSQVARQLVPAPTTRPSRR